MTNRIINKTILAAAALWGTGFVLLDADTGLGQSYDLSWHTMDGGGGYSAAGGIELEGTLGQHDAGGAMTGGSFSVIGGFWAGISTGGGPVCARAGTLIEGVGQQNDFNATCGSDDVRWGAHGATFAFQVADPVVQFELVATAPAGAGGGSISVDIEASKQNTSASLNLRARMFNFTTGNYVSLPGVMQLTTSDAVRNFTLPNGSNPNEFIDPNNNDVILLLQTIQTSGLPNVRTRLDEVLFNFD